MQQTRTRAAKPLAEIAGMLRRLRAKLNNHSKYYYLARCRSGASVLDVGCGNESPAKFKNFRSDIEYFGIDLEGSLASDLSNASADFLLMTDAANFHAKIGEFRDRFDLVVCAHNLEHCLHPDAVVDAICGSVADHGVVFFSFPADASVRFPSRRGTLNFYDDPTHKTVPNPEALADKLRKASFEILICHHRARFWPEVVIGLALEPISALLRKTLPCTWALWGFESVVVARKRYR